MHWHAQLILLRPTESRALSTNQQAASEQRLETIRLDTEKEALDWLQTPRSSYLLARCAAAGVEPQQVANPETLLPHVARACLRLSRWLAGVANTMLRNHRSKSLKLCGSFGFIIPRSV